MLERRCNASVAVNGLPMSDLPFKKLTVIGLGLIGGSFAMAARECFPDWQVQGIDPDADALDFAKTQGVIHTAAQELPAQWEDNQLIVLACHITPSLEVLARLAPNIAGKNILMTDIGSCKREITALGRDVLPQQFIAGHPMAGKEFSGIRHATPLLFANKSYLLCPHQDTPSERLADLQSLVRRFGAIPRLIDAERHDEYMAFVSHLPQLYSVLLANLLARHEPGRLLTYYGGGLDGQLRLAASPFSMWGDVFKHNAGNLKAALEELRSLIDEVLPSLDDTDEAIAGFASRFARANEVHRQFEAMKSSPIVETQR